jgi:hypothetical protein
MQYGAVTLAAETTVTLNQARSDGGGVFNDCATLEGAHEGVNVFENEPNDIVNPCE